MQRTVQISGSFKKKTKGAILSIISFIFVYSLLLLLALGLALATAYAGIWLMSIKFGFLSIGLGLGIMSMGILVLIFLFKFMFKKHEIDRSHLTEIYESEEPALFEFVRNIANEVGTDFPKRIYLSGDINASVFYDSTFWSMFFPIKKNLHIGIGLVNTVSEQELKAILAHEFGHFSQKSMKVGSYIYNVNQVIFNLLYDNESYNLLAEKWANASSYFALFVTGAVKITNGIQYILKKMYGVVNLSYMALSREMEFHADEVAASVTGHLPLKNSLLRLDLAQHAYNRVLTFYEARFNDGIKSQNVFKEQSFVMNYVAADTNIGFENGLPLVTPEHLAKYNKSKLNIKDQWASHPSTADRIATLERLNISYPIGQDGPAAKLFSSFEATQVSFTEKLFEPVPYKVPVQLGSFESFKEQYMDEYQKNSFSALYNGYFDNRNPVHLKLDELTEKESNLDFEAVLGPEKIDLAYSAISLESDLNALTEIGNNNTEIKTFDYDGVKCQAKEAATLQATLSQELEQAKTELNKNDEAIFLYFYGKARQQGKENVLLEKYKDFFAFDKFYETNIKHYVKIAQDTQFINTTTPYATIESNLADLVPTENELKKVIREMLETELFQAEITSAMREAFEKYVSKDWIYFSKVDYLQEHLEVLFEAIDCYYHLLLRMYFIMKRNLLNYQAELYDDTETIVAQTG